MVGFKFMRLVILVLLTDGIGVLEGDLFLMVAVMMIDLFFMLLAMMVYLVGHIE